MFGFSVSSLVGCLVLLAVTVSTGSPIDTHATPETRSLYHTLAAYSRGTQIMFGQHRATELGCSSGHSPYRLGLTHNGHRSWAFTTSQAKAHANDDLCDVKDVTREYPAVLGFDLGDLRPYALQTIQWLIKSAHEKGLIVTISWHQHNPMSGASAYTNDDHHGADISNIISRLLENGDHNHVYRQRLDIIADWAGTLRDKNGNPIPVIFRPYHEMNGDWFWWGTNHLTNNNVSDYKQLYQYTVKYLRDTKSVHNFLYAFSPSKPRSITDYQTFYPGHQYVDVLGFDFYYSVPYKPSIASFVSAVQVVTDMATAHDKIAAITEVGLSNNGIEKHHKFWSDHVLTPLKAGAGTLNVAYMFTWTNSCVSQYAIYVPYQRHAAANDFLSFYNDSVMVFGRVLSGHTPAIIG